MVRGNKMKKILFLFFLLIITGCDVQYNLTITNKEEVKENFYVYIDNKTISNNSMTVDEYLDYYSNLYTNQSAYNNIKITTKKGNEVSYFLVKNNYKNLDEYIKSYTFKNMFSDADIERVGKYTSFMTSNNVYLEAVENGELLSEQAKYDSFKISIKFYNKLANHNADEIDEKNNIYSWNIQEHSSKDYIYFKLSPEIRYDVMIKDYILNNLLAIVIAGGLILIITFCLIYVAIKIKKNNEI